MKKSFIFLGLLAIGYANAQHGNIGINTTSNNATLEIQVADINSNNDTNQGVLIPKLTKDRVASIADTNLVKGTLIFVEGINYTGNNTKVSDINADGFYYYNGTKWIRVEGSTLPKGTTNGQVLQWNGTAWTPNSLTYSGITNTKTINYYDIVGQDGVIEKDASCSTGYKYHGYASVGRNDMMASGIPVYYWKMVSLCANYTILSDDGVMRIDFIERPKDSVSIEEKYFFMYYMKN